MQHEDTTLIGRTIDEWTFQNADTQYLTHGLHPYPARMIPQVAEKLIKRYSKEKEWVLDPFCGSGTVLVECKLKNRNSIGNEINPLAVLLSKVKTTPLSKKELENICNRLLSEASKRIHFRRSQHSKGRFTSIEKWVTKDTLTEIDTCDIEIPAFPNIDLWFKKDVIDDLSILRKAILNLNCDEKYIDFLRTCLSFTAMKSSNADFENHQSHPSRYKLEKLEKYEPDALVIFRKKVNDSIKRLVGFSVEASNKRVECFVLSGDAKTLDLKSVAPSQGVDLIVTSPPYGEEQNTIGYHRWSRIMACWISFSQDDIKKSEKLTLGAKPRMNVDLPSRTANFFINLVKCKPNGERGEIRAHSLASFFYDYHKSIIQMAKWLKTGGIAAIVVGNRQVAGHRIAMDRVTLELAEQSDLREVKTFYRDIPNTVMPKRIPEGETIARESIIILRKM